MTRVSITSNPFEAIEVELWDVIYKTVRPTRSVELKVFELEAKADQATDLDEMVDILAQIFDAGLEPVNGSKTKPSTLIKKKWKADEVTVDDLQRVSRQIQEEQANPSS